MKINVAVGSVSFDNGKIGPQFDKPTLELEFTRRKIPDEWLRAELGTPPYQYSWSELVSIFDLKGCVSEIVLRHAK